MRKIVLISLLCVLYISCSSKENKDYTDVVIQLKNNYNKNDYEAIFNMYSVKMQDFSNKEKTKTFYKDKVKADAGNWISSRFKTIKNGKHIYEVSFENSNTILSLKLNSTNKINYLLLKKTKER